MQKNIGNISIKKYVWLIGLVIVMLVGLGIMQLINQREFRVVSTTPSLRNVSFAPPFLKVNFNRELSSEKLEVRANANIIDEFHVTGKTLHITINRLGARKAYVITIRHIQDEQGSVLRNKTISFTATNDTRLSRNQTEALTRLQDRKTEIETDPLLPHVPHNTLHYRMNPVFSTNAAGQQVLTLEVQIIIPPDVAGTGQEAAVVEQYKNEVLDYIRSFGLDPANYNLQYEIIKIDLDGTRGGEL